MSKTVILLNPYGSDVTNFLNHSFGVSQLMNGTVAAPGDTVYTLPYNWNTSTAANITNGASLLDTKLRATSGTVLVFGYSEGCQIADYWLTNYGPTSSVSTTNVSFLLIGNADNKYGGFAYNRSVFNTVAYTGGKPDATPYTVIDFVRQYDPIGDFPSAAPIVAALTGLQSIAEGGTAFSAAMSAVSAVLASGPFSNAMSNCLSGLALIHTGLGIPGTGYMSVTTSDSNIVSLVDGNITWMWSPTYPIPMLGTSTNNPQQEYNLRTQIETAYSRPVSIPMPAYVTPSPKPNTTPPVPGWWAELYGKASATIIPVGSAFGQLPSTAAATITPTSASVGFLTVLQGAAATVTPAAVAGGGLAFTGTAATTLTPAAAAAGHLTLTGTAAATITPTPSVAGSGAGTAAVTVTPAPSATGLLTPNYDHSAASARQSALASGTAFTWSSGGGTAGAYGIVFVAGSTSSTDLSATASVTWGGTAMTSLGSQYNDNISTDGWGWVFVLNGIPAGSQTISVTLTQAGKTFTGEGSSYSYANVSSVGALQTAFGLSITPSVAVTAANTTDIVWGALQAQNHTATGFSGTLRQSASVAPAFYAGDTTGSATISATASSSTVWSAFGLDLR